MLNCAIYIIASHRSTALTGELRQTVTVTSEDHQAPLVEGPQLSSLDKISTKMYRNRYIHMQTGFNVPPICQKKPGESLLTFLLIANIPQVSVCVEGKMVY